MDAASSWRLNRWTLGLGYYADGLHPLRVGLTAQLLATGDYAVQLLPDTSTFYGVAQLDLSGDLGWVVTTSVPKPLPGRHFPYGLTVAQD